MPGSSPVSLRRHAGINKNQVGIAATRDLFADRSAAVIRVDAGSVRIDAPVVATKADPAHVHPNLVTQEGDLALAGAPTVRSGADRTHAGEPVAGSDADPARVEEDVVRTEADLAPADEPGAASEADRTRAEG